MNVEGGESVCLGAGEDGGGECVCLGEGEDGGGECVCLVLAVSDHLTLPAHATITADHSPPRVDTYLLHFVTVSIWLTMSCSLTN